MTRSSPLAVIVAAAIALSACPAPGPPPTRPTPQPRAGRAPPRRPVPPRREAARVPIKLTILKEDGQTTVVIKVGWLTGSADDPPGKEGLTCLTADLLKEGGTQKHSYAELLQKLYPMAAQIYVQCSKEMTVLTGRFHQDHIDRFLALFGQVLTQPRLDPAAFKRLRRDATDEVGKKLRFDRDEDLGKAALTDYLYPGHPYRHPEAGTVQGLNAITLADVKRHLGRVFTQDRLIAGIGGGVTQAILMKVNGFLRRLPARGAPRVKLPAPAAFQGLHVRIVQKKGMGSAISIGFPIKVTRSHPDFPALALAASYFGEHRQSFGVLYQKMRGKRGMNYGNYAYTEHFEQEGWGRLPLTSNARRQQYFSIWIRPVAAANAHFALRYALRELKLLLATGISKAEFERARAFLGSYSRLWVQTTDRRLGYALDARFFGNPGYPANLATALARLTPAKVLDAIKRHWTAADLKVALVHPQAQKLAEAIRQDAPSPIKYRSPKPAAILKEDQIVAKYRLAPAKVEVVALKTLFER